MTANEKLFSSNVIHFYFQWGTMWLKDKKLTDWINWWLNLFKDLEGIHVQRSVAIDYSFSCLFMTKITLEINQPRLWYHCGCSLVYNMIPGKHFLVCQKRIELTNVRKGTVSLKRKPANPVICAIQTTKMNSKHT